MYADRDMPNRSASDWIQEGFALAALVTIIGTVAAHWTALPAQVPRHFGISGNPDGWGDRNGMLLLPLTAIGLYILITVTSRYQRLINVPMTIDRDAPEVQRLLRSMSITLKMVVLFVIAYIEWTTVNTALGRSTGLGRLFLPISLIALFIPLGLYLRKLRGCQN
jgi:uncharacterized membrane protein